MKFAKACKVLRFVLLLFVLFFGAILALAVLEWKMPELATNPRPEDEILANLVNIAIYTAVFLVLDIICFAVYASHKKSLKQEQDEDRRVDGGSKRKTKTALRVFGILAIIVGLIGYVASPLLSWLIFLGIILIAASFRIKVREHAGGKKAKYEYESNLLHITYPAKPTVDTFYFIGSECSEIMQDAVNDGYLNFEKFEQTGNGQVRLTFSTDFSREELQRQHDNRDKAFSGKGFSKMPDYYSDKPQTVGHIHLTEGEPYQKKEEVYIYDEYDIYKDGKKVRTEQRNKRFSHYVMVTYQQVTTTYNFFNLDETPFCDKTGRQLSVSTTEIKERDRKRL